jgi:hypothetical protein
MWWLGLLIVVVVLAITFISYNESDYYRGCSREDTLYFKYKDTMIKLLLSFSILAFLSNLVPDKKAMIAIIATPIIVDSYNKDGGKLHTLDSIIDEVLAKANKYLKDKED